MTPVASIEEAASEPADLRLGERGSAKVAGFDFGNPPTEILASNLRTCPLAPGLPSLRRTAPGSLRQAPTDAPAVYAAAFVNVGARAGKLATFQDVTVVGCGREAGRASSENEDAVGALLRRLEGRGAALDAWAWRRRRGLPPAPPRGRCATTARRSVSSVSRTRQTWNSAPRTTPCRSCRGSRAGPSWGLGRAPDLWPRGQTKRRNSSLTRKWSGFTLQLARADQTLQDNVTKSV